MKTSFAASVRREQGETDPQRAAGDDQQGLCRRCQHGRATVPRHKTARSVKGRIFRIHNAAWIPGKGNGLILPPRRSSSEAAVGQLHQSTQLQN